MLVSAIPRPFSSEPVVIAVPEGETIAQIIDRMQPDPVLRRFAHVYVGDSYICPTYYHHVRPKAGAAVSIRIVPGQGGGGGKKNPIATILMVAVVIIATVFGQYYVGPLVAGTYGAAAGAVAGAVATAVVATAGAMIINAIFPVRPPALKGATANDSPTYFIEGARNQIRPFEVVPLILGRHKFVPPYGAKPYSESMGTAQYARMHFVWGTGPLEISDVRIGDTPIEQFDEVEIETRQGFGTDAALTLFPSTVDQQDLSIQLKQTEGWITRTTAPDTDEISLDVSLPGGLFVVTPDGDRHARHVSIQAAYRLEGAAAWSDIPGDASISFPRTGLAPPTITFFQNITSAVRHGIRWRVPVRGRYEVRLRRTSPDQTADAGGGSVNQGDQVVDQTWWTALRSFTNEDPVASDVPLAMTAMRIRATDQLNNVVDELNAVVTSVCLDWNGTAWVQRATRNPASLFRHALQGAGIAETLADARIDLDGLQAFHDWCRINGFTFDMVRDFESSAWELLADIAAAGRGSPTQRDGKWSVVFDQPQSFPVQHFTPRNSWGFQATKSFVDMPHGFRVRFLNEEQGWNNDERIVYDDGYSAANATRFEGLELPGVTVPDAIYKHARFHIAQAKLRPERWILFADIEHIVCRRGSLVKVTHDVLLVGQAQGRIVQIHEDTNGDLAGVTVDELLTMEAGTDYGLSIRTPGNAALLAPIAADPGEQTEVFFTTSIPAAVAPDIGDLFGFGPVGAETADALVLAIEPQADFKAQLLLVPYQAGVYTAADGPIPPFDTGITPLPSIDSPVVLSVRSDETALARVGNTLEVRIEVEIRPLPTSLLNAAAILDVQIRAAGTDETWLPADLAAVRKNGATLRGVREGETVDIRLRWRVENRLPGAWSTIANHRVVGKSSPPAAPQGLTISVFGGSALLRWDPPSDIDVRFGGTIRFRHSPAFTGAAWAESVSIGNSANSTALVAVLPLKPGTYLARTFDSSGNPSTAVSTVTTKQATVLEFANVDTVTEDPAFSGIHTDTVEDAGILKLASQGDIDDAPDFDEIPNLDALGGIVASGVYDFDVGFDFGTTDIATLRVRLTSHIAAISVNELDLLDDRIALIDTWEDFDGTTQSAADCQVWVRHTDDDPLSTDAIWSEWERLDSAEFDARAFQFQARLTTDDPAFNINVSELSVVAEALAA